MYAIFKTGGKQLKAEVGDKLFVEKLNLETGNEVVFDEVLLIGEKGKIKVGTPTIKDAKVTAKVVKEGKAKKVLVFKYKAKTNHDILRGHRQPYTLVEITGIEG
ncbi:MAG: 50S ribosomal protein L21 [Candidatus Caccosoma sp.]|nr:50S ribosomal protein L21 [Candidatus Caccosoma sp.]